MTLSDLASLGSFVSGVAVLISLVFLGLQIRQGANNQRAVIQNERAKLVQDLVVSLNEPGNIEVWIRGDAADGTMDDVQCQSYLLRALCTFRLIEEFFHQHRDGMMSRLRWESNVLRVEGFARTPGLRAAWRTLAPGFSHEFALWMNGLMQRTEGHSGAREQIAAFRTFAAEEAARATAKPASTPA